CADPSGSARRIRRRVSPAMRFLASLVVAEVTETSILAQCRERFHLDGERLVLQFAARRIISVALRAAQIQRDLLALLTVQLDLDHCAALLDGHALLGLAEFLLGGHEAHRLQIRQLAQQLLDAVGLELELLRYLGRPGAVDRALPILYFLED